MFTIIEMADIELIGVHLFESEQLARETFDRICAANFDVTAEADASDLGKEISGTLALVGDDAYSVQLIERPVIQAPPKVESRVENL